MWYVLADEGAICRRNGTLRDLPSLRLADTTSFNFRRCLFEESATILSFDLCTYSSILRHSAAFWASLSDSGMGGVANTHFQELGWEIDGSPLFIQESYQYRTDAPLKDGLLHV